MIYSLENEEFLVKMPAAKIAEGAKRSLERMFELSS